MVRARRVRRAISLPELLVVVGIIVLLACLLFPSMERAREQARRTLCSNNLRQFGVATQMYRDDNYDYLPTEGTFLPDPLTGEPGWQKQATWFNALPPYLELPSYKDMEGANVYMREVSGPHVWICPSKNLTNAYRSVSGKNQFHYGMNDVLDGMGSPPNGSTDAPGFPDMGEVHVRAGALAKPTISVVLFDIAPNSMAGSPREVATKYWLDPVDRRRVAKFHGDYANILYLDGNVTNCGIDDLVSRRDNRRGRVRWSHPRFYWGFPPRGD